MINNTPTLMQSEEKRAPWNERYKTLNVTVSQMLSADIDIKVPEDFDESDSDALNSIVIEQVLLPSEAINKLSIHFWGVDDFCVSL